MLYKIIKLYNYLQIVPTSFIYLFILNIDDWLITD